MVGTVILIVLLLAVVAGARVIGRNRATARAQQLEDAKAEARRWVVRSSLTRLRSRSATAPSTATSSSAGSAVAARSVPARSTRGPISVRRSLR